MEIEWAVGLAGSARSLWLVDPIDRAGARAGTDTSHTQKVEASELVNKYRESKDLMELAMRRACPNGPTASPL
jgi:hypothetical protein